MEAMEIDPQPEAPAGVDNSVSAAELPVIISDSGSSTEVDEEEEDDGDGAAASRRQLRLPATWAFSQRRAGRGAAAEEQASARRRLRQGLRVHYSSQNAASSRGFPYFLLRVPAATTAPDQQSSSTEVSDSSEEGEAAPAATAEAVETVAPAPPTNPSVDNSDDNIQVQEADAADGDTKEGQPDGVQPPAAPPPQASQGEEGDSDTCSICFEAWTTAGEHRIAALRCGHLFGYTCIHRWLTAQRSAGKCPQCNKKAKRSDILRLYAPKLRAMDNSEHESLKKVLEEEQSLRRKAELESAQYKLKLQVVSNKYGQAQQELKELRAQMAQTGRGSAAVSSSSSSSSSSLHCGPDRPKLAPYGFFDAVLVSQNGGCRVLSYCEAMNCLLASQPSPHATLVPGWGVKKVSLANLKSSQYIPIHSNQIRGLCFNRQNDSLLLSAALDCTIKLTSLLTNTVVQTYNTGKPVWSCCWCLDSTNYVYAGLSNGSVLVYDIRDTSTHVQELEPLRSKAPVASLCYLPKAASSSFPCGGLIAGSPGGGCFWEQVNETTYKPHMLPLEPGGCTDIQVETESRHCLVTYRPSRLNTNLRCVLMALTRTPQEYLNQPPGCCCLPVQTFNAGSSCKHLTKNAIFTSPDGGGALVCAGDEASNSTMVWEAAGGTLLQKLPADLPVLDIAPFRASGDNYLVALTEKMMKLYKWK